MNAKVYTRRSVAFERRQDDVSIVKVEVLMVFFSDGLRRHHRDQYYIGDVVIVIDIGEEGAVKTTCRRVRRRL